jgi:uncharacterized protein (DUF362 family)
MERLIMDKCPRQHHYTRREFLRTVGTAAAGLLIASCAPQIQATQISTSNPPTPTLASTATETVHQATATPSQAVSPLKSTVSIAQAKTYDPKLIRQQVQTLLDGVGGLQDVLAHGNRVAIKVNLTGGTDVQPLPGIPEIESYLTHPEVVHALGEALRDSGVTKLYIVEAAYQPKSWSAYGYKDMAKSIDAELVDLTYSQPYKDFVKTPVPGDPYYYDKFIFNSILNDVDTFISVSKMKCHNIAGVTHTMKNLVGLVPYRYYNLNPSDAYRSGFHGESSVTKTRLPRVILDLNRARPVQFGLIDGIMTAEGGEGPWIQGQFAQVKPGVLFAGKDPVATDAVATAAMGFDPTADYPNTPFVNGDNHLNLAYQLGLGTNRLEEITVVGPSIEEVLMKFKPSL